MTDDRPSHPYAAGRAAQLAGQSPYSNPFHLDADRAQWIKGWMDSEQQEAIRKRQEQELIKSRRSVVEPLSTADPNPSLDPDGPPADPSTPPRLWPNPPRRRRTKPKPPKSDRRPVSFRLGTRTRSLLRRIARRKNGGTSRTAVIRILIDEEADRMGIVYREKGEDDGNS